MANKRKTTTAIVAGVTALALVLGGTFAWTSIQQEARNEAIVDINPGGRLHDDFNGTNKDVYVENFGDDETGVPIYARIRLDQYMEIGQGAGEKETADKKADSLIPGADINTISEWETYIPGENKVINEDDPFFKYWTWDLGNGSDDMPYYMPTFNKNKDSLAADRNGTYEGTVEGDIVHYDDYKTYEDKQAVIADATYDWDDDTVEEDTPTVRANANDPWDSADIYKVEETHEATQISSTADVILMDAWLALSDDEKATTFAWVYDTDGWAYWSQAIQPGQTTGLLLSGISQARTPDDSWYYGINVVGQFATSSDLSAFENEGGTLTDGAKELLGFAAEIEAKLTVSGPTGVMPGKEYTYTATMTKAAMKVATPALTWTVENVVAGPAEDGTQTASADDGIEIDSNGKLAIAETVTYGTTFDVVATADGGVTDTISVTVVDSWQNQVDAATAGSTETVNIDGIEWFVLKKDSGKALLLAAQPVGNPTVQAIYKYGEMIDYFDGDLNVWLNTEEGLPLYQDGEWTGENLPGFMTQLTDVKSSITETLIYDFDLYTTQATYEWSEYEVNPAETAYMCYLAEETKVFLPSASDFQSLDYEVGIPSTPEKNGTVGKEQLITADMTNIMLANTTDGIIPTRTYSPATWSGYPEYATSTYNYHGVTKGDSGLTTADIGTTSRPYVFPMMWVKYDASVGDVLTVTLGEEDGLGFHEISTDNRLIPGKTYRLISGLYSDSTLEWSVDEKFASYVTFETNTGYDVPEVFMTIKSDFPDIADLEISVQEKRNGVLTGSGNVTYRVEGEPQQLQWEADGFTYTEGMELEIGKTYKINISGKNYNNETSILWPALSNDSGAYLRRAEDGMTAVLEITPETAGEQLADVFEFGVEDTEWHLYEFPGTRIKFKWTAVEAEAN